MILSLHMQASKLIQVAFLAPCRMVLQYQRAGGARIVRCAQSEETSSAVRHGLEISVQIIHAQRMCGEIPRLVPSLCTLPNPILVAHLSDASAGTHLEM